MKGIAFTSFNSIIGEIFLARDENGICMIKSSCDERVFVERLHGLYRLPVKRDDEPFREVIGRLKDYLSGKVVDFNGISLNPNGTEFERIVWKGLCTIPYGETRSYKWLAAHIGKPFAYRAVGNACAKNPLPIIIPCHRVIREDGGLGGYSGGLLMKKRLLKIEGVETMGLR